MPLGHDPKAVAKYLLYKARESGKSLTPMQVLKLVYIAHGWMLGLTGRPLINELAEAWRYGPVVPSVYHEYKRFGGGDIDCEIHAPEGFDVTERGIIDQVWNGYGAMDGIALSSLTHKPGTPWFVTYNQAGAGSAIPNDLIQDHYRQLAERRTAE